MSPAEAPSAKLSAFLVVLFTGGHTSVLLGLVTFLVKTVPDAKKKFDEHAVMLPSYTLEIIRFSDWLREYGWWLVAPVLAALVGDYYLMKSVNARSGTSWFIVIALMLFLLLGLAGVAIKLPMLKTGEA